MWMLPPGKLCVKHLLGEHVETHMLLGSLQKRKNLSGFFEKGLLEPGSLLARHDQLAAEMGKRGYNHKSFMDPQVVKKALEGMGEDLTGHTVDPAKSAVELARRCETCRKNLGAGRGGPQEA